MGIFPRFSPLTHEVVNCVLHSGDVSNPCRAWDVTHVWRLSPGGDGVETAGVESCVFLFSFEITNTFEENNTYVNIIKTFIYHNLTSQYYFNMPYCIYEYI